MTEGEVISELVEFTNILLVGVSLIFSVISAYVVALNYFIGSAAFVARLGGFAFITLILGLLVVVMMGAQATQMGLVDRLHELARAGELTAAGRAVLANAEPNPSLQAVFGQTSIDEIIRWFVWSGIAFVYAALAYMTFLHTWRPDAIPVTIEDKNRS